jgi:hypothetical protein
MIESTPALPSRLPTELVIIILSAAATRHRATAARLCLVAKWVRDLIEPILYRVLALRDTSTEEILGRLYSSQVRALTRCFGAITAPRGDQSFEDQHARISLPGIRNLGIDNPSFDDFFQPGLEELHVFPPSVWRLVWTFPGLQRLHFCHWQWFIPSVADNILNHPRLTHVAFSVREEPHMSDLELGVDRLLKKHRPLVLLLVRLLPGTKVVQRGAVESEPLEMQLGSLKDRRLVLQRINLFGKLAMIDEWERDALNGESIWDKAQASLNAPSSPAASC